jgi:hypothetical protein
LKKEKLTAAEPKKQKPKQPLQTPEAPPSAAVGAEDELDPEVIVNRLIGTVSTARCRSAGAASQVAPCNDLPPICRRVATHTTCDSNLLRVKVSQALVGCQIQ